MDHAGNPSEEQIAANPVKYCRILRLRRELEALRAQVDPEKPAPRERPTKPGRITFAGSPAWVILSTMPPLAHWPHKPAPFKMLKSEVVAWALQKPEVWDWIEGCASKHPVEKRWNRATDRRNEKLWFWVWARLTKLTGPTVCVERNGRRLWEGIAYEGNTL
jgi:hypothetical protein